MRRIMLLALLTLALPTAMWANSFNFPSGNFMSGTISGMFANGGHVDVSLVGSLNTIGIVTGTLHLLPPSFCPGSTCFKFFSGTVTVGGGAILTNGVNSGFLRTISNEVEIEANLAPSSFVRTGSVSFYVHFSGASRSRILTRGEGGVQGQSTIPEPGTLGLFGTGLLGLAGLARRKLKLGT